MTDDIRKLLGGYATGTLTEAERKALYEAALHDETLFAAIADEQELKDLLDDSSARAQLLQAVENPHFNVLVVLREWFERPRSKVMVAVGAVVLLAVGIKETLQLNRTPQPQQAETVAVLRQAPAERPAAAPRVPEAAKPAARPKREAKAAAPSPAVVAETREPEMPQRRFGLAAPSGGVAQSYVTPSLPPAPTVKEVALPDGATRVASAGEVQVKYTVLLRNSQGEYHAVPPDYEFASTDRVRLQVEVNREGVVGVQGRDEKPVFVRNVTPGRPIVVPADFEFQQASSHEVEISFLPISEVDAAASFADRQKATSRAIAPSGTSGAAALRSSSVPADRVTVQLYLRRKL